MNKLSKQKIIIMVEYAYVRHQNKNIECNMLQSLIKIGNLRIEEGNKNNLVFQ